MALGLDPECLGAYRERALVYHKRGDHDRAIADCTALPRRHGRNGRAWVDAWAAALLDPSRKMVPGR